MNFWWVRGAGEGVGRCPLTGLSECETAFQVPSFTLYTNASNLGLGAILPHKRDVQEKVKVYAS